MIFIISKIGRMYDNQFNGFSVNVCKVNIWKYSSPCRSFRFKSSGVLRRRADVLWPRITFDVVVTRPLHSGVLCCVITIPFGGAKVNQSTIVHDTRSRRLDSLTNKPACTRYGLTASTGIHEFSAINRND